MKTLKLIALLAFVLTGSFSAHSQTATGKVYLIRSTGYAGLAVNYHFFVDGKLVCKQKNRSYSIHDLNVGDHMISITTGGLPPAKKTPAVKITVVEGKTNFISVVSTEAGYLNKIACQEITENSAQPLLAKAKEKTNCLAKE
ncbi:hypothetical protein SAMN06265348_113186 [Pedobacter westerhofensis]|uniref:DUF2846 domain-containing protein n=1 Tax=Pedobacter westerhofensis TaxID=425512 RepID=A0A521FLJ6_9SPHI|nr:hypothetical protein [Pedobacter westerhofensis]SMO96944.1 hypothetical protein SAMN06265348_113186 [Pedobacter westerhofensis]